MAASQVALVVNRSGSSGCLKLPDFAEALVLSPKNSSCSGLTPADYWDERARGLGATTFIPVGSSAEENAMCHDDDRSVKKLSEMILWITDLTSKFKKI